MALVLAAAFLATSRPPVTTATLVPTLILSPSSGEAPNVSGSLSGSGWDCGTTPYSGGAAVSGAGVSGNASITRGTLSGSFVVSGTPGQTRTVSVQATTSCPTIGPPVFLAATATFTFNPPSPTPPPTRTPTPLPTLTSTVTPAPSATPAPPTPTTVPADATATPLPRPSPTSAPRPSPTATPSAGADPAEPVAEPQASSVRGTIMFAGCEPATKQLSIELLPVALAGDGAEVVAAAIGSPVTATAAQSAGDPRTFELDLPEALPGQLFRIAPKLAGAACVLDPDSAGTYWAPGGALVIEFMLPGSAELEGCVLGNVVPCEHAVVKGVLVRQGETPPPDVNAGAPEGAWDVKLAYYPGELQGRVQRFRWQTDAPSGSTGVLQASVLPYAKKAEGDPLTPAGLVATWPVSCLDCEFTADLTVLAPPKPKTSKSLPSKVGGAVASPFKAAFNAAAKALGLKKTKKPPPGVAAGPPKVTTTNVTDNLVGGAANILLQPTTYYFRVVPVKEGVAAGAPTNPVVMQQVPKPDQLKITLPTATPTPGPNPYEVAIVSYHGIIPPKVYNKPCYVVTEEAWPAKPMGFTYTTDKSQALPGWDSVKPGHLICKPDSKEKSLFEKIVSWATDTIDWASAAWKELKGFAVNIVLQYTPLGLQCTALEGSGTLPKGSCQAAFATALDAALVSLGVPPDIPNFDQLMDQGIDYLAVQAAAQISIPPEVVKAATQQGGPLAGMALDAAEAKLREEMEAQIKANLKDAVKQVQLGYAKSVSWVPDGIPVRPDDYQPPGATLRVTRKAGVPGGDQGCTLSVQDYVKLGADFINNPPPEWASTVKGLPTPLSSLTSYDFFANEADLGSQGFPGGADKQLSVPPLAPGESMLIPLTFKPNYYKSGWHPLGLVPTNTYITVWHILHEFGTLNLSASGTCGSASLTVPAKAQLLGAEVVGP